MKQEPTEAARSAAAGIPALQGREDVNSNVPTRPRTGDTGDTSGDTGDTRRDGVRFAYRATIRRAQVHRAITEAFDLLGAELAHHPDEDDLPRTPANTTPPVAP